MKRNISLLTCLALAAAVATPVYATNQTSNQTTITTEIKPAYIVTIPVDTKVKFNEEKTEFGAVKLESAQLEPNKAIYVSVISDGKMENKADSTKTISYKVTDKDGAFDGCVLSKSGDAVELAVEISKDDWNSAYAGEYSDTLTFNVEYKTVTQN